MGLALAPISPQRNVGQSSTARAAQTPLASNRAPLLVQAGRLSDKIKNFCENHLYSRPAPELDSLYPSSAQGHSLPSSICKGSAGSAASQLCGAAAAPPASIIRGREAAFCSPFAPCPFRSWVGLLRSYLFKHISSHPLLSSQPAQRDGINATHTPA